MRAEILIMPVLALGLAVTGCSSNKTGIAVEPSKSQQQADRNEMNPQSRDRLQQGGKLVWAIDSAPANFNLGELDGSNIEGQWIVNAVLPSLFTFDASATPAYDPDYLTGEPKVVNGPPQVVTYELNPKAIWYDGTPVTAADFIALWKSLNGTNKAYHISSSNGYDQIQSVTQGASKFEVIVTFREVLWRLERAVFAAISGVDQQRSECFQHRLEGPYTSPAPVRSNSKATTRRLKSTRSPRMKNGGVRSRSWTRSCFGWSTMMRCRPHWQTARSI